MGQVWAYDFVFDACANGQQLKCLTVDEFTHECLAIDVAGSIRSGRVIEVLSKLVSVHGSPKHLRSDTGPEFVSRAVPKWLTQANIDTAHIDPGKPWQNGTNESFNGKFRDECLSMEWFRNRIDAKIVIEQRPPALIAEESMREAERGKEISSQRKLSIDLLDVRLNGRQEIGNPARADPNAPLLDTGIGHESGAWCLAGRTYSWTREEERSR